MFILRVELGVRNGSKRVSRMWENAYICLTSLMQRHFKTSAFHFEKNSCLPLPELDPLLQALVLETKTLPHHQQDTGNRQDL